MIKNVIFDLGNVVTAFDPFSYFIHDFHDIDKTKEICHVVFGGDIWNRYDQGLYTKQELRDALVKQYPSWEIEIETILSKWVGLLKTMPKTVELMEALRAKHYHIYIMSNLSEESHRHLIKHDTFLAITDGGVFSYAEKINKPDPRLYHILLDRYQLKAHECVFIDDRKENIETAHHLGMYGIVYQNHEQMMKELTNCIEEASHA